MLRVSLLLLCFLSAGAALASSPAEAIAHAATDMQRLPAKEREYTRYLSRYHKPEGFSAEDLKVLTYHLNGQSREAEFSHPRRVTAHLVAIHWPDYGWPAALWEKLATVDPYFHQKVKLNVDAIELRMWPGGIDTDGKFYEAARYRVFRRKGQTLDAAAPWIESKQIIALREATYSEAPVLRADWFIDQTGIQTDRVAGYYDWLGLGKKEADFEKLIGANKEESRRVKKEVAAAMARSGVTLQNRGIVRFQSITGPYWVTQDFKRSVARQNVLRLLDQDREPPQGDASEQYGTLPNGLFAFWLQNGKGERQDAAPDFIASDHQTTSNDRRIHAGKSCITCHLEGIRPIDDYARRIYRGAIKLSSPDYDKFLRLRQLYLSDLDRHVRRDQADYADALLRLNGMKPAELARAYGRSWDAYAEADLGPAEVAREMGVDEKAMLAAFKRYASPPPAGVGEIDPVLAGLLQVPPVPIRREHWEEVFGTAMTIIRGYKP